MTRLLFINPVLRLGAACKFSPVGMGYVLTAVKKAGYQFDFIDMDADDLSVSDVQERLRGKIYDFCGFGCIVTGLALIKKLAEIVRLASPDCCIVAGNSVATSIPRLLLERTEVDIAALGEGDITVVEIIRAIERGQSFDGIPGIAYLKDGVFKQNALRPVIANLDDVGFPDWNIFDMTKYNRVPIQALASGAGMHTAMPLNGARGCPFNCTFCYHVFKGQKYRKYSESVILNEFIRLKEEFGATFIYFWDEISFLNLRMMERMVCMLETLPFRLGWQGTCRIGLFDATNEDLLRRAKDAGCATITYSIESASPVILKAMNKKITHDKTVEQSLILQKVGIVPVTSLIFGFPQETPETIRQTLELCERCNIYPSAGYLLPLPGTPVYDWAVNHGYIQDEWEYLLKIGDRQDFHINLTSMSDSEFQDTVMEGMADLASKMGLYFDNPLKTVAHQKSNKPVHDNG